MSENNTLRTPGPAISPGQGVLAAGTETDPRGWVNSHAAAPDLPSNSGDLTQKGHDSDVQYNPEVRKKWRRLSHEAVEHERLEEAPFPLLTDAPALTATRYSYDVDEDKFKTSTETIKISPSSFARGSYRECFYLRKLSNFAHPGNWERATRCVAKRYIPQVVREVCAHNNESEGDGDIPMSTTTTTTTTTTGIDSSGVTSQPCTDAGMSLEVPTRAAGSTRATSDSPTPHTPLSHLPSNSEIVTHASTRPPRLATPQGGGVYMSDDAVIQQGNAWTLRDVKMQVCAKRFADAYNATGVPKGIDFLQAYAIELPVHAPELNSPPDDNTSHRNITDDTGTHEAGSNNRLGQPVPGASILKAEAKLTELYCVEHFLQGEYTKYNNNAGWVSQDKRNSPHAFSHFTFQYSKGQFCVVDIQGVDDIYTDPQIHTAIGCDRSGFGDGDLGPKGMALFFYSHRCNPLCSYLKLKPFDLFGEETEQDPDAVVWHGTTVRHMESRIRTSRGDSVLEKYCPPPNVSNYSLEMITGLVHLELARFHAQDILPFKGKMSHALPNAAKYAVQYHMRLARESGLPESVLQAK